MSSSHSKAIAKASIGVEEKLEAMPLTKPLTSP